MYHFCWKVRLIIERDILIFVESQKKEISKRIRKRYNFNPKVLKKLKKLQLPLEI